MENSNKIINSDPIESHDYVRINGLRDGRDVGANWGGDAKPQSGEG